ncbi:MAG: PAS domain S-box protein [Asgard group archaeon]|nr:PAS domain S-box protein [Asgard group archaeon]
MKEKQENKKNDKQLSQAEFETSQRELEKAKSDLASFNDQFEALFEMTNDAIILMDTETLHYVKVNKKAIELFGLDPQKINQYKSTDFIFSKEIDSSIERLAEVKKGKLIPIYERTFHKTNGEIFIAEINLSLVHDTAQNKDYLQSIIRDITLRKQLEASKEKERKIYQKIAKAAIETVDIPEFCNTVLNDLLKYLDFDLGTLRIYNEETKILEPLAIIGVSPKHKNEIRAFSIDDSSLMISEVIKTKKPLFISDIEKSDLKNKFQSRIELFNIKSIISCPILNKNADIIGSIQLIATKPKQILDGDIIFFDSITNMLATALERFISSKELQKLFKEREDLYSIISLSPVVVFIWKNEEGWPVEYVSENIKRFGYSPDDFYLNEIAYSDIIHPEDLAKVMNEVSSYSKSKHREEFIQNYRIITKTGNLRWIEDYTTIHRDKNGKIINYNGIILDITDRVIAESKIKIERQSYQLIADAATKSETLPDLCQYILDGLVDIFRFDIGSIRLLDKEKKLLIPYASINVKNTLNGKIINIPLDDPNYINALVARTRVGFFAPDIKNIDLDTNYIENLKRQNVSSLITWPILDSDNQLLGVLQLAAHESKEITDEDKIVFNTIADTLANNIQRLIIEEEKRQSEAKFRAFAEQSLAGVLLFKGNGEILFSNNQMASFTEYSKEEILQMSISDYFSKIHPGNTSFITDVLKQANNKLNEYYSIELEIVTKTNKTKWVNTSITNIESQTYSIYALLSIDITEEKNYQLTLLRERSILKQIAEATSNSTQTTELCQKILEDLIHILELETGSIRLINNEDMKLYPISDFGILNDERYLLRPISKTDDHPISKYCFTKEKFFSLDASKDEIMKNWSTIKDFDYKTYISWPILNANQEYLGRIQMGSTLPNKLLAEDQTFFDSITEIIATAIEHIKALEELKESEEKFKRTVENISDGILIIENNKLVYMNNQVENIIGYNFNELQDMKIFSFFVDNNLKEHKNLMQKIFSEYPIEVFEQEMWFTRKDGASRCMNSKISFQKRADETSSVYILIRDVTDRKMAEETLHELNEQLERRVIERTSELERVNKELEAFSYSVSHDLRSPLRSIDGFSHALLEDYLLQLDETGQDYLKRIRAASQRMSNLIDGLLSLSRLSRREIIKEEINLSEIAFEIIDELKQNEPDREIVIDIQDNIVAKCDPVLMRTILVNLLANAWKFTSKTQNAKIMFGSKIINNETIYYIKDNGIGFDMSYANKLFSAFQRLHSEKEFEGSGIGLTIVYRIIERYYGRIWTEAQEGKGATFYFTLEKEEQNESTSDVK